MCRQHALSMLLMYTWNGLPSRDENASWAVRHMRYFPAMIKRPGKPYSIWAVESSRNPHPRLCSKEARALRQAQHGSGHALRRGAFPAKATARHDSQKAAFPLRVCLLCC
jgi:hypothetical protein